MRSLQSYTKMMHTYLVGYMCHGRCYGVNYYKSAFRVEAIEDLFLISKPQTESPCSIEKIKLVLDCCWVVCVCVCVSVRARAFLGSIRRFPRQQI